MLKYGVVARVRSAAHLGLLCGSLAFVPRFTSTAGTVTLAWDPSPDATVVGYNIYYGVTPGAYTNKVSAGNQLTLGIENLTEGLTYYFAGTAYTVDELESDFSVEVSALIPSPASNAPPIALPMNVAVTEDQNRAITLSGSDPDEDPLTFEVLSAPQSGSLTGTAPNLNYIPGPDYFGSDSFSFRVNDGKENSPPATVTISVTAVNDAPTLNGLPNLNLVENAGVQTIALSGITSGAANEPDTLVVTATSSNPALIPHPAVAYSSPSSAGVLTLSPAPNTSGSASISVSVSDGQLSSSTSFLVTIASSNPQSNALPFISLIADQVTSENIPLGPIAFTVGDPETGAGELALSASVSVPSLLPLTNIVFGGADSNRTVTLWPSPDQTGETLVTLTVSDGLTNSSTTFSLTVLPPDVRLALQQEGDGTIYRSASGNTYTLSAVADAGQVFSGWSGSITSSSPKLTFVARSNILLKANFSPITVSTKGSGIMVPNLGGLRNLVAGRTYRITASPRPGFEFSEWTGSVPSQSPVITFVMEAGMVIEANFVPSPYIPVSGSYSGLFHEDTAPTRHVSSGGFNLILNRRGYYTGRVILAGKPYTFTGKFGLDGRATKSIVREGTSPLELSLEFGITDKPDQICGTISDGTWTANITSDRAVFGQNNPAPFAGRYTFVMPGTNADVGHSFGTLILNRSGLALFSGKLADNTPFTRYLRVSKDGHMPLYLPLYQGRGSILSWVSLNDETDGDSIGKTIFTSDFRGAAMWTRPELPGASFYPQGFERECAIFGSAYVRPTGANDQVLNFDSPAIIFSDGDLTQDFGNELSFGPLSVVKNLGVHPMAMTFNRANGTFRGIVIDPNSGMRRPFGGVAFQKQAAGFGMILGDKETGSVVVENSVVPGD